MSFKNYLLFLCQLDLILNTYKNQFAFFFVLLYIQLPFTQLGDLAFSLLKNIVLKALQSMNSDLCKYFQDRNYFGSLERCLPGDFRSPLLVFSFQQPLGHDFRTIRKTSHLVFDQKFLTLVPHPPGKSPVNLQCYEIDRWFGGRVLLGMRSPRCLVWRVQGQPALGSWPTRYPPNIARFLARGPSQAPPSPRVLCSRHPHRRFPPPLT